MSTSRHYLNEHDDFYEKSGMDYLIANGSRNGLSLRLLTIEEFDILYADKDAHISLASSTKAKAVRDLEVSAPILYDEVLFSVGNKANDIRNLINDSEITGVEEVNIKLYSGEWRVTTIAELRIILKSYSVRSDMIWEQFKTWTEGKMRIDFYVQTIYL